MRITSGTRKAAPNGRSIFVKIGAVELHTSGRYHPLDTEWYGASSRGRHDFRTTANDFRRALNDLEGSFLKISDQKVSFLNASIRDFVQNLFRNNADYGRDLVESAVRFLQIRTLRDLQKDRDSTTLNAILKPAPQLIEALRRVITGPHIRWHQETNGQMIGTYLDDSPDNRLRTIIQWAEDTKSRDLLSLISLAYEHLQKSLSIFIPGMLVAHP